MYRFHHTLCCLAVIALLASAAVTATATTWDLAADWSDVQNPFGVWMLRKSPTELFAINVPDYWSHGSGQRAWTDQPFQLQAHVPSWMKVSSRNSGVPDPAIDRLLSEVRIGDILMHGAEFDRTGTNYTSVVWKSPVVGSVSISGAIWQVRDSYRQMTWQLRKNGAILSHGTIVANGTYTYASPFELGTGAGGGGALAQSVNVNDQIELAFISDSYGGDLGDHLGLRLAVSTIPEPSSILAVLCGVCGTAGLIRRRK